MTVAVRDATDRQLKLVQLLLTAVLTAVVIVDLFATQLAIWESGIAPLAFAAYFFVLFLRYGRKGARWWDRLGWWGLIVVFVVWGLRNLAT